MMKVAIFTLVFSLSCFSSIDKSGYRESTEKLINKYAESMDIVNSAIKIVERQSSKAIKYNISMEELDSIIDEFSSHEANMCRDSYLRKLDLTKLSDDVVEEHYYSVNECLNFVDKNYGKLKKQYNKVSNEINDAIFEDTENLNEKIE